MGMRKHVACDRRLGVVRDTKNDISNKARSRIVREMSSNISYSCSIYSGVSDASPVNTQMKSEEAHLCPHSQL